MSAPHHLDLKRMRYIIEVARAEGVTNAADNLGITQSALSRNIAEVEAALGVRLFERLPRGIALTAAGQRFIDRARTLLGDVDNLVAHVQDSDDLAAGRLRLGISPAGYLGHATVALADFAHQYPGIGIEVVTGSAQNLCPRLLQGDLDLIIGSSSYLGRWRELSLNRIVRMHLACMLRHGHPLTQSSTPTEADVLAYPVVLPDSVEPIHSDLARRYAAHKLPPLQPQYVTDSWPLTSALVTKTNAFTPLMFPDESFAGLGNEFALLRGVLELPTHYLSVAHASTRPRSSAATRLTELLEAHYAERAAQANG